MNEKLINILLSKIDELERELEHDNIYIKSLETEQARLNQVIYDLKKKLEIYE